MLFYPWVVSAAYLDRISSHDLAAGLEDMARAFSEWDANALVFRYAAYRGHDVSAPFDAAMLTALGRITAPTGGLASASDRLLGTEGGPRIPAGLDHSLCPATASLLGH